MFRKFLVKNDDVLQKYRYVKLQFGKELILHLDCRTRWHSILTMLERFVLLQNPITMSPLELKNEISFSDQEHETMQEIINVLKPVKLAVEGVNYSNSFGTRICHKSDIRIFPTPERTDQALGGKYLPKH